MKKRTLDQFLSEAKERKGPRCKTCESSKEIRDSVIEFLDRKRSKKTSMTLQFFHRNFLVKELQYRASVVSLRSHVFNCLNRDGVTGDAL